MRICLVTCSDKPEGTADDRRLQAAMRARGHTTDYRIWSEPGVDWASYELCLLRSPWDYYKRLPDFLQWAERVDGLTKLANSLATVAENADKKYLVELADRGLPVVPSYVAETESKVRAKAELLLPLGPIVVKPTVSGGSYLTFLVKEKKDLLPALQQTLPHGPALLQPYLPTIAEHGEISLIYYRGKGDWEYSHAVLKTAARGDFRVQTDFGGKVEAFSPNPQHFELAERSLAATTRAGDCYARLDFVDWNTSPLIGEVELIEPALFFEFGPGSAERFAEALSFSR